jgi:hypothetical protein
MKSPEIAGSSGATNGMFDLSLRSPVWKDARIFVSYVAQEVMLRDSSKSAHLAGALRARNIISINVNLRSPSRRRITIPTTGPRLLR